MERASLFSKHQQPWERFLMEMPRGTGVLGTKEFAAPYPSKYNIAIGGTQPQGTPQSLKAEGCFLRIFPGLPGALLQFA